MKVNIKKIIKEETQKVLNEGALGNAILQEIDDHIMYGIFDKIVQTKDDKDWDSELNLANMVRSKAEAKKLITAVVNNNKEIDRKEFIKPRISTDRYIKMKNKNKK